MVLINLRIEIQQHVRHLGDHPSNAELDKLEKLCNALGPMMTQLTRYQLTAGIQAGASPSSIAEDLTVNELDVAPVPAAASALDTVPIERHPFFLPSNGSFDKKYQDMELLLRIEQAKTHLNQLRDLIAEKSFQYSDVIRHAPTKGVSTRGRMHVKSIDNDISFHAEV